MSHDASDETDLGGTTGPVGGPRSFTFDVTPRAPEFEHRHLVGSRHHLDWLLEAAYAALGVARDEAAPSVRDVLRLVRSRMEVVDQLADATKVTISVSLQAANDDSFTLHVQALGQIEQLVSRGELTFEPQQSGGLARLPLSVQQALWRMKQ